MTASPFPDVTAPDRPTLATLHAYARAVGVLARAHAVPHPRWWHISLRLRPRGLATAVMAVPGGGACEVVMDLADHVVVVETHAGEALRIPMDSGLTGTAMGDRLIGGLAGLGFDAGYARDKFEDVDERPYDRAAAGRYLRMLLAAYDAFERFRASLSGDVGPIQVWPHGFDLAFEWFGARTVVDPETGDEARAQINLGLYPAGDPYFYSNPWPFDPALAAADLPYGAMWHLEGWQGSELDYETARTAADPAAVVIGYAAAVHAIAAPALA